MASSSLIAQVRTWTSSKSTWTPPQSPEDTKRLHLYGLRGILAVCGVLTVFIQTFVPALVWKDEDDAVYLNVLRIVFSPILWDERLISSFFLALSCHTIALRFLNSPTPLSFAGSLIRRVIRMPLIILLASAVVYGIFGGFGTGYIEQFKETLPNQHIMPPQVPENGLIALNAIFDIFWAVRGYYTQAANTFWPTQTMWNLSLIFNQSWTIYFLMIILPYTRPGWHALALFVFAFGSFWMCSWGWYSAAALLLADYSTSSSLRIRLDEGLTIRESLQWKIPYKFVGIAMTIVGFAMKFTWAVLPQYYNKELVLHPFIILSEKTNVAEFAAADPYPRVDNFLVIFGILLLSETSVLAKSWFSCKPLVTLGKRSMSTSYPPSMFYN
jgi:hypothetical protein